MDYFLKTKRCGFSHWKAEDLPYAISLWGQPEVTRYITASGVYTHGEIQHRLMLEIDNLSRYGVQYFPVYALDSTALIGCCGLRPYKEQPNIYELGFHLRKEFWHQGYASECGRAMMDYAFRVLGAVELKAGHNPNNIASKKVLQKLGFCPEGEEYYPPTGLYHPLYRYLFKAVE